MRKCNALLAAQAGNKHSDDTTSATSKRVCLDAVRGDLKLRDCIPFLSDEDAARIKIEFPE